MYPSQQSFTANIRLCDLRMQKTEFVGIEMSTFSWESMPAPHWNIISNILEIMLAKKHSGKLVSACPLNFLYPDAYGLMPQAKPFESDTGLSGFSHFIN